MSSGRIWCKWGFLPGGAGGLRNQPRGPHHARGTREAPDRGGGGGDGPGDAESIFIDEGFTPQLIAEALPRDRPLTVITSSLTTAAGLAQSPEMTVLVLGGRVRGRTLAAVDQWASAMLDGFVIDLAFVGANGISREHGLATPDPAVADVKAHAMRAARRIVFAGVHTKFGASSFCRFGAVADLETIITDGKLPAAEAQRYSLLGPHVMRVCNARTTIRPPESTGGDSAGQSRPLRRFIVPSPVKRLVVALGAAAAKRAPTPSTC